MDMFEKVMSLSEKWLGWECSRWNAVSVEFMLQTSLQVFIS